MSKIVEMNIIHSYPLHSFNRDGNGRPKTNFFGNVERGRTSAQAQRRAMRDFSVSENPSLYGSFRSRNFNSIVDHIAALYGERPSEEIVKIIRGIFLKKNDKGEKEKEVMIFMSNQEFYNSWKLLEKNPNEKDALEIFKKSFMDARDNCEIASYGRMVANNPSLQVEGFVTVANSLSTHKSRMEFDFFSAVDELTKDEGKGGAGHIDSSMCTSYVAYRYIGMNLDLAYRDDHLGKYDKQTREKIIRSIAEAAIYAIPKGKKTSFPANTLPSYINIIVRNGQQAMHSNAFFTPIKGVNILEESISTLKSHIDQTFNVNFPHLGRAIIFNKSFPELNAEELVNEFSKFIQ